MRAEEHNGLKRKQSKKLQQKKPNPEGAWVSSALQASFSVKGCRFPDRRQDPSLLEVYTYGVEPLPAYPRPRYLQLVFVP